MRLSLHERPDGVVTEPGSRVVYDVARAEARLGAARVEGPALVWELGGEAAGALLSAEVSPREDWLVRCDRVEFPPGGVAHRHVHPGPGIRYLLSGELAIEREGDVRTYRQGEAWFEDADDPVLATASATGETAFARVLLLPAEWRGRRTIRYVDPADEGRPRLQRATILLEEPLRP